MADTPKNLMSKGSQLSALTESILAHGHIHDIQDVIDAVSSAIPQDAYICIVFHQQKWVPNRHHNDLTNERLLFNYISFYIDCGKLIRFNNRKSLFDYVAHLSSREDVLRIDTPSFTIWHSPKISLSLLAEIKLLCTTFFITSDVHSHYIENTARRISRQIFPFRKAAHDLPEISKFIASQFHVGTAFISVKDPLNLDLAEANPEDFFVQLLHGWKRNILQTSQILNDVVASIRVGNDYSGRIKVGKSVAYYKLIPISIPARIFDMDSSLSPTSPRKEGHRFFPIGVFLIISSRSRIDRTCVATAKELIREIAGTKNIAEQLQNIRDLHGEILETRDRLLRQPLTSQTDALNEFSGYANKVARSIVDVTSAHSATVRIYDPFRNALHPVGKAFNQSLSSNSRTVELLQVKGKAESVNSFVFSRSINGIEYIGNVKDIDSKLKLRGLTSVYLTRKETKCELCIRLSKNTVPIGTLNIEAPYAYALGHDLLYCQAAARLLTEFYNVALTSSDSGWLPKISMAHLVYHRIQKVRRDQPSLSDTLDFIENPIQRAGGPFDSASYPALTEILADVGRGLHGLTSAQLGQLVKNKVRGALTIRPDAAPSIAIILETLIENCRIHANLDKDDVTLAIVNGAGEPVHSFSGQSDLQLRICYTARIARERVELLDSLTIAPIWADEDQSYHFGMFLLGAHARLLGGVTYVDAEPLPGRRSRPVRVIVTLPMESIAGQQVLN